MRIYFRIHDRSAIKWPDLCLWCGSKADKMLKIRKRTIYNFKYCLFWFEWESRTRSLTVPACKQHYIIGRFVYPSWIFLILLYVFIFPTLIESNLKIYHWVILTLFSLLIVGVIYFRQKGLKIQRVNEFDMEISLPEGVYAEALRSLNNWSKTKGKFLIQENYADEINSSIEESCFEGERELCPDDSCNGIIEDGRCTVCSKMTKNFNLRETEQSSSKETSKRTLTDEQGKAIKLAMSAAKRRNMDIRSFLRKETDLDAQQIYRIFKIASEFEEKDLDKKTEKVEIIKKFRQKIFDIICFVIGPLITVISFFSFESRGGIERFTSASYYFPLGAKIGIGIGVSLIFLGGLRIYWRRRELK